MAQVQCPKCKKDIEDDFQYCSFCGHRLVPVSQQKQLPIIQKRHLPQCPKCNRDVSFTSENCPYCGEKLIPEKAPDEKLLIQCPKCKRDIFSNSEKCTYCNFRLRKRTNEEIAIIENEEIKGNIFGLLKVIFVIVFVFGIAMLLSSNQKQNKGPSKSPTTSEETTFSNRYIVNEDVIFAATSEENFNTLMNCVMSKDLKAIENMVLYGQVKYLHRNEVVHPVTLKMKYFIVRPAGSTEMLYVVGEQLSKQ